MFMSEGDACPSDHACPGNLVVVRHGDCSCHMNPPCNVCLDVTLECDACGYEPTGEEECYTNDRN